MTHVLRRGLLAGAVGTTVINAVTYADMAWRGRDASSVPGRTVEALAAAAGVAVPGDGSERANRVTALGALSGTVAGLAVGVAAAAARAAGVRTPGPLGAVAVGAAAMAAGNGPSAVLRVTDPRDWTSQDWLSDVVPHLAYGAGVVATLRATHGPDERPLRRARPGTVARALLLGVAAGSRSSLGPAAPSLVGSRAGTLRRAAGALAVGGELVADKLPGVPLRTSAPVLPGRLASGAVGATMLAHRHGENAALPALASAAGAAAGAFGGVAWRGWAAARKVPDVQAALLEDAVALTLAVLACRPSAADRRAGGLDRRDRRPLTDTETVAVSHA